MTTTPFGLPAGDTNSDGDCDAGDATQIQTWIDGAQYNVLGDLDLDGDVDTTDKTTAQNNTKTLGWTDLTDCGNRNAYAGYQLDSSLNGLYHIRYRVYSCTLGRFCSRDPFKFANPLDLYQYVSDQPIRYLDDFGLVKRIACGDYHKEPNYKKTIVVDAGDDCCRKVRQQATDDINNNYECDICPEGMGGCSAHVYVSGDDCDESATFRLFGEISQRDLGGVVTGRTNPKDLSTRKKSCTLTIKSLVICCDTCSAAYELGKLGYGPESSCDKKFKPKKS